MKFIADVMLGRLAKWLRILGYDVVYNAQFEDDELFFRAHQEKRVLLTRDTELAARMNPQYCELIEETEFEVQLKHVISKFDLNVSHHIFTRCLLCNEKLAPEAKERVKEKVPEYVFETTDQFYRCPKCQKIYWAGSHIEHIKKFLETLKAELTS